MASVIRIVAIVALVCTGLTACGKKGTLESPEVAEKPASSDADKDAAGKDSGGKKARSGENSSFVLDPLLR